VLAGGQTKQGDAGEWLALLEKRACAVVLFGAGAFELKALIEASSFDGELWIEDDLDAALSRAMQCKTARSASTLLLSPACASFDQYSDFEARGEHFRTLIKNAQAA